MEAVQLNMIANSPYSLFNLTHQRAEQILDALVELCGNVYQSFPNDEYAMFNEDKSFSLNMGKVLEQMLSVANTQDEQNFILYSAHTGIESLHTAFNEIFS